MADPSLTWLTPNTFVYLYPESPEACRPSKIESGKIYDVREIDGHMAIVERTDAPSQPVLIDLRHYKVTWADDVFW